MSDQPSGGMASLPLSIKKKSRNSGTNVSKKLMMEFQALIAFASFDSPSINCGGHSMTEATMEKLITKLCFGDVTDENTISYVDQFLHGLNRFKGLFTNSSPTGDTAPGEIPLSIPPLLHRQGGVHIFVGEGSIEKGLLCSKSLANQTPITGRTLLRLAKEVLCNCKKMQALVTRRDSPYKDMNYIPSGTNWEDYVKWCLSAMYKAEGGKTEGTITTSSINEHDDDNNNATSPPAITDANEEGDDVPVNYFFKGFLAWCLWGWIPIQPGAMMKSSLFSDVKCDASLGRNTTSRQAIKAKKSVASESAIIPRQMTALREHQPVTQSDLLVELRHATRDVLQKTYQLFEAEFAEKEQQKTAFLEVRIIRDNLASLTRKQDRLLKMYYNSKKGPVQNKMKTDLDRYEAEILELETSLQVLQESELHRRKKLMLSQGVAAAVNMPAADVDDVAETAGSGTTSPSMASVPVPIVEIPFEDSGQRGGVPLQSSITVCSECKQIPSTHKCRKCRQFVCDLCCSEKRGLELVWWCGTCFDNESLSNQRQICDGKYESDGE